MPSISFCVGSPVVDTFVLFVVIDIVAASPVIKRIASRAKHHRSTSVLRWGAETGDHSDEGHLHKPLRYEVLTRW
jgi:hypothetical protein